MTRRLLTTLSLITLLAACSSNPATDTPPAGYYRVQKGDTLYRIAVNNGQSVNNLVRWNNLKDATSLEVGQVLRVTPKNGDRPAPTSTRRPASPAASETTAPAEVAPKISLIWPAKGQVLKSGDRNNGIDITGNRGDAVLAAASGKVVYAGEGIRGYGKLLVIKHSEVYLTAYAHNDALAVKEGDDVKQGQRIASMGDSGADRVALHFELRYKGKAIDPTSALP
ncbi:peptidoglycan DD-metalloendopeptidase family protein [Silvimonas sp. JCM 19000]